MIHVRVSCLFCFVLAAAPHFVSPARASDAALIKLSRDSCVEVWSETAHVSGTAFFVADQYVATCNHVIASTSINSNGVTWVPFANLKVRTSEGEVIEATCVSVPTDADPSPFKFDFAVLKLKSKSKSHIAVVPIAEPSALPDVGSDAYFSGYPLATPAMVTHKAMISGIDSTKNIICIQSAVNKGNSGGALISYDGKAIGIITLREGGISKGLQDLSSYIDKSAAHGSVQMFGVDPLQSIRAIVQTLDTYISTGIGYAISTKHVRAYLEKHPDLLR